MTYGSVHNPRFTSSAKLFNRTGLMGKAKSFLVTTISNLSHGKGVQPALKMFE